MKKKYGVSVWFVARIEKPISLISDFNDHAKRLN